MADEEVVGEVSSVQGEVQSRAGKRLLPEGQTDQAGDKHPEQEEEYSSSQKALWLLRACVLPCVTLIPSCSHILKKR